MWIHDAKIKLKDLSTLIMMWTNIWLNKTHMCIIKKNTEHLTWMLWCKLFFFYSISFNWWCWANVNKLFVVMYIKIIKLKISFYVSDWLEFNSCLNKERLKISWMKLSAFIEMIRTYECIFWFKVKMLSIMIQCCNNFITHFKLL